MFSVGSLRLLARPALGSSLPAHHADGASRLLALVSSRQGQSGRRRLLSGQPRFTPEQSPPKAQDAEASLPQRKGQQHGRTQRLHKVVTEEAGRDNVHRHARRNKRHLSRPRRKEPLPQPETLHLPKLPARAADSSASQETSDLRTTAKNTSHVGKRFEETMPTGRAPLSGRGSMTFQSSSFSPEEDVLQLDDIEGMPNMVVPGDLVEIQRGSNNRLLVVTSRGDSVHHYEGVSYKEETINFRATDIIFHSPDFLRSADFNTIFPKGLCRPGTDKSVNIEATVDKEDTELLRLLAPIIIMHFDRAAMARQWTELLTLQHLYDVYHCEEGRSEISLIEVAQRVFGVTTPLTEMERYATHRFITRDPLRYIPEKGRGDSFERLSIHKNQSIGRYRLRPVAEVERIERAMRLIRDRDEAFMLFMQRIKAIIAAKPPPRIAEAAAGVTPSAMPRPKQSNISSAAKEAAVPTTADKPQKPEPFSDADRSFIELVRAYIHASVNGSVSNPFVLPVTSIIKPLRRYGDLSRDSAASLLVDIGVWPAWENVVNLDESVPLPGLGISPEQDARALEGHKLAKRLLAQPIFNYDVPHNKQQQSIESAQVDASRAPSRPPASHTPLGPEDFYQRDILDDLRHDFGNLPVYTIDDASAKELDDGISVEHTAGGDIWLHVHVADPTAYIPPEHKLARMAEARGQTVYHPERHYPMLPDELSVQRFSLGTGKQGEGRNVMTFSARLCPETGEILESAVRAGIVHQVYTLSYDNVDSLLDWSNVSGSEDSIARQRMRRVWTHADGQFTMMETAPLEKGQSITGALAEPHIQKELHELQHWSNVHMRKRMRDGMLGFSFPKGSVSVTPFPLPVTGTSLQPLALVAPQVAQMSEPALQLQLDRAFHSPSRIMVAELMVMAGRVCADWCRTRKLPVHYRCQDAPSGMSEATHESIRMSVDQRTGLTTFMAFQQARPHMSPARINTQPLQHWTMGIRDGLGYIKCTSPLRRYVDMVTHWQIKAQMLREHDPRSAYQLPFSQDRVEKLASQLLAKEREVQRNQNRAMRIWMLEFIRRIHISEGVTTTAPSDSDAATTWSATGARHWPAIVVDVIETGECTVLLTDLGINARMAAPRNGALLMRK
ncbi:hypothetical protein THASP1DRAFT_32448, partial [Thamnocephalis sphaerospora]